MKVNKEENITTVSEENIYKLNGRVPLNKAIPFAACIGYVCIELSPCIDCM